LHNAPNPDHHLDSKAEERLALATKLHETVAQDLALLGYRIDELIADSTLTIPQRSRLRELRTSIIAINKRFRDVIYLSKPRHREALLENLKEILGDQVLDIDLSFPLLKSHNEELLASALIEIARNTARHAQARNFYITFEATDEKLVINVSDDGKGIAPVSHLNLGIRIIDQNLKELCASYTCESDGSGTRYTLNIDTKHYDTNHRL
jgi:signal transduction histidine kinase